MNKNIIAVSILFIYFVYNAINSKNNVIKITSIILIFICIALLLISKGSNNKKSCKSDIDCSGLLTCVNNNCVLNNEKKSRILNYLTAIYPNNTFNTLTDLELNNFFMYLGFYWVSYHTNIDNVLQLIDENFPSQVYCGAGFTREGNAKLCGGTTNKPGFDDIFFEKYSPIWPANPGICPNNCCCKMGTLYKFPPIGNLYTIVFLWRDIEVLRNGYDCMDTFNKSVLYDPIVLYNMKKLNTDKPKLSIIKNGIDNSGSSLSYLCCDNSATYDFTKQGGGYPSNSLVEVSRDRGDGKGPDAFYYISSGTGNFLNLGTTIRALNKIHAMLLIIRRAGELNFGSFTTYLFPKNGDNSTIYTKTKKEIKFSDNKTISNSFIQMPQLLVLEFMVLSNYMYGMNNPGNVNGFATENAKKLLPNEDWPFDENGSGWVDMNSGTLVQHKGIPYSGYSIKFHHLLSWFFKLNKSTLPDITNFSTNWNKWKYSDAVILGKFMDAVTVPYFDSWELNFCFNRLADSAQPDAMVYQFLNPAKSEIRKNSFTVNPLDTTGNAWGGITNSNGKYIETISYSIQPNSSGVWAFEMLDFRIDVLASTTTTTSPIADYEKGYWNEYANKFIKIGDPLSKNFKACKPNYCENNEFCLASPDNTLPLEWKVFTCS